MKVLRVINSLKMGGAERSIETNVPKHIKNGIETDVLLLSGEITPFYESLVSQGVKVFVTSKWSIYNPLNIIKIIPYIRKYDIIHVHLFPALYWVCFAKLLSFAKTPLIYTEHSTNNRRRNSFFFKPIDRFVYRQYKHIISISDATTKKLVDYIGSTHRISTIYNGVDLIPYTLKYDRLEFFPDSDKTHVITQIASFRYPKDQKTTIRALKFLDDSVHAVFVGAGDEISSCKNLAEEIGVKERVHFLNNRTDIPAIVASSDIIVMSSIYEGFGRAAVEGMAGKKPVVASNVPGLCDVVKGAGLLFEAQNEGDLANCICQLLGSNSFYEEVANRCYLRSKDYDVHNMIEGYETIYYQVVKKKR